MDMKAELAYRFPAKIGESPRWDSVNQRLMWVDIDGQLLCFFDPKTGSNREFHLGSTVGVAVFAEDDLIAVALKDRFALFDEKTGDIETLAIVEARESYRFNDGGVDPAGRFFAGTMEVPAVPQSASLYSIDDTGQVVTRLSDVGLTNGMAWSLDAKKFYFADTLLGNVRAFDYNLEDGSISNPVVIFELSKKIGLVDGLIIDSEGCLWLAIWGGSQVIRLSTEGKVLSKIELPVTQVSSMGFGGKNLDHLFITTATLHVEQSASPHQPLAGSLFVADLGSLGIHGVPENLFKVPRK